MAGGRSSRKKMAKKAVQKRKRLGKRLMVEKNRKEKMLERKL